MYISCACDLHLKLGILNLVNINNQPYDFKKEPFPL